MSSLSPKDRVSLCSFTFSDGRRCRTPRIGKHPRFCSDHAEKEARARAAQTLGKDLAYFFSGDYLSACDLTTALGRLIPAVLCGDVKPRAARTVAYLAQTLLQAIHISQHEYTNAFGSNAWRNSVYNSVTHNHDYLFPPHRSGGLQAGTAPQPQQPATASPSPKPPNVVDGLQTGQDQGSQIALAQQPSEPQPAPPVNSRPPLVHPERMRGATHHSPLPQSPHTPLPITKTEFVQQVLAGPNSSRTQQASQPPNPVSAPEAAKPASPPASPPTEIPANCHSEHREESAFSSSSAALPSNLSAPRGSEGPLPQPQTGPSGLPILAALPSRNPSAPKRSRSS